MSRNSPGGFDASDDMEAQGSGQIPSEPSRRPAPDWPDDLAVLARWAESPMAAVEGQNPPAELMAAFRVAAAQARLGAHTGVSSRASRRFRTRWALISAAALVGVPSIAMAAPSNVLPEPVRAVVEQVREVARAVLQPLLPDSAPNSPAPADPGPTQPSGPVQSAPATSPSPGTTDANVDGPDADGQDVPGTDVDGTGTAPDSPAGLTGPVPSQVPVGPGGRATDKPVGKPSTKPSPAANPKPVATVPKQVTPKASTAPKQVTPKASTPAIKKTPAPPASVKATPKKSTKAPSKSTKAFTGSTESPVVQSSSAKPLTSAKATPNKRTSDVAPTKSKGVSRFDASPEPVQLTPGDGASQ
jgi:hypothetical protein